MSQTPAINNKDESNGGHIQSDALSVDVGEEGSLAMGNGASITHNKQLDAGKLRSLVAEQQKQLKENEAQLKKYEEILSAKEADLRKQEELISRYKEEIHKLKSVLSLTASGDEPTAAESAAVRSNILAAVHRDILFSKDRNKRKAVSGESGLQKNYNTEDNIVRVPKDSSSKKMIKEAILGNDFTKNFETSQISEIVDCMYAQTFNRGELVIREGDAGSHLYVSAEGELEVSVSNGEQILGKMNSGKVFGELAILYNCQRTASVRALTEAKLWVIDRKIFQIILMKSALLRQQEYLKFLKSVPLLKNLSIQNLSKLVGSLEVEFFHEGDHIIREGIAGDTFYIISKGSVKVTQSVQGYGEPQEVRKLKRGDYFGEKALLSEDVRTANIIALEGCECLVIDRMIFKEQIGDLEELQKKDYGDKARGATRLQKNTNESLNQDSQVDIKEVCVVNNEYMHLSLQDLSIISTLGMGAFGRVELVYSKRDKRTFALKTLKKKHIVDTKQQDHIYSEKKIMMEADSPFITKLYRTFKDRKYVYMLMEVCLGGELWTILRDQGSFNENTTKFFMACVIEAFGYLHGRGIAYRDLKPENLLLDNRGYVKLVDFGFAKKIGMGKKTWTFCGTPEYLAPEIILNKGHNIAADYWSLGILMYEFLTGNPPFTSSDAMSTYNLILKGIEIVEFPKKMSKNAHHIIKKFCRESPSERLGYQKNGIADIKKQKWFLSFDWNGLMKQTIKPPIVPQVLSDTDFSNFDKFSKDNDIPVDEMSGWDSTF